MKCPVNREKTKITRIEDISMLGVYTRNGKWYIDRDKLLQQRSDFRTLAEKYTETRDELLFIEAIQRIGGSLPHYQRIPGIAMKKINSIKRWCLRIWNRCCHGCDEKYRRWFLRVVNP